MSDASPRGQGNGSAPPRQPERPAAAAIAVAFALFAAGTAICLEYGRLGFMALDQSIVFDGGWRVLSGQVPFRDFTTATSVTPVLMQALFFSVLGVNWPAYLLHAAVLNGSFCVLVFAYLRTAGAGLFAAGACGLASGLVFYAPMGTPFPGPHAFFFALIALALAFAGARASRGRVRAGLWAAIPTALALSFLSKQNVAVVAAMLVATVLSVEGWRARSLARFARDAGAALAVGSAGILVVAAIGAALAGVEASTFVTYYWSIPLSVGGKRFDGFGPAAIAARMATVAVVSPYVVAVACLAVIASDFRARASAAARNRIAIAAVAFIVTAASVVIATTTLNQVALSLSLLFLSLGLAHHVSRGALRRTAPAWTAATASVVCLAAGAHDAHYFRAEVNQPRRVLDLDFDPTVARALAIPGLEWMQYQAPAKSGVSADDLEAMWRFLMREPGEFLLVGDHSILYALTGRSSQNPALWYHREYTVPRKGSRAFVDFESEMLRRVRAPGLRFVILEGDKTWMGVRLAHFSRVRREVNERRIARTEIGPFAVIELAPVGATP